MLKHWLFYFIIFCIGHTISCLRRVAFCEWHVSPQHQRAKILSKHLLFLTPRVDQLFLRHAVSSVSARSISGERSSFWLPPRFDFSDDVPGRAPPQLNKFHQIPRWSLMYVCQKATRSRANVERFSKERMFFKTPKLVAKSGFTQLFLRYNFDKLFCIDFCVSNSLRHYSAT